MTLIKPGRGCGRDFAVPPFPSIETPQAAQLRHDTLPISRKIIAQSFVPARNGRL